MAVRQFIFQPYANRTILLFYNLGLNVRTHGAHIQRDTNGANIRRKHIHERCATNGAIREHPAQANGANNLRDILSEQTARKPGEHIRYE